MVAYVPPLADHPVTAGQAEGLLAMGSPAATHPVMLHVTDDLVIRAGDGLLVGEGP